MTVISKPFALSLLLGLGSVLAGAAFAQETAPAAPAPDAAAPAPAADDLSLGQQVGPDGKPLPKIGQTYVVATFEQWEQRCVKTPASADPCEMYQLLKDNTGNSVAEISMASLPPGGKAAAGATLVAPLGTLLPAQLALAIDGTAPKVYPFTVCTQIGCFSRIGFTEAEVTGFKKGATATVTIVPYAAPDQKVELAISLKGFTAAFEAVTAANIAADAAAKAAAPATPPAAAPAAN